MRRGRGGRETGRGEGGEGLTGCVGADDGEVDVAVERGGRDRLDLLGVEVGVDRRAGREARSAIRDDTCTHTHSLSYDSGYRAGVVRSYLFRTVRVSSRVKRKM